MGQTIDQLNLNQINLCLTYKGSKQINPSISMRPMRPSIKCIYANNPCFMKSLHIPFCPFCRSTLSTVLCIKSQYIRKQCCALQNCIVQYSVVWYSIWTLKSVQCAQTSSPSYNIILYGTDFKAHRLPVW